MNSSLFDFDHHPDVLYDDQFVWFHGWLSQSAASRLLETLLQQIEWKQESIMIAGKKIAVPRLECWMGDANASYSYSGIAHQPVAWHPAIQAIKEKIEQQLAMAFNSCLINYYRDHNDSVAWHSDDEPELGDFPCIASLSLGAQRNFLIKNTRSKKRFHFELAHGDLLIMQKESQKLWQHCLPKQKVPCGPRINLTFRRIISN